MPKGNPSPQTKRTAKYQEKAGWMSKTYKLKKELVEQFAESCDAVGVSQSAQLSKMMEDFIKKQKERG